MVMIRILCKYTSIHSVNKGVSYNGPPAGGGVKDTFYTIPFSKVIITNIHTGVFLLPWLIMDISISTVNSSFEVMDGVIFFYIAAVSLVLVKQLFLP